MKKILTILLIFGCLRGSNAATFFYSDIGNLQVLLKLDTLKMTFECVSAPKEGKMLSMLCDEWDWYGSYTIRGDSLFLLDSTMGIDLIYQICPNYLKPIRAFQFVKNEILSRKDDYQPFKVRNPVERHNSWVKKYGSINDILDKMIDYNEIQTINRDFESVINKTTKCNQSFRRVDDCYHLIVLELKDDCRFEYRHNEVIILSGAYKRNANYIQLYDGEVKNYFLLSIQTDGNIRSINLPFSFPLSSIYTPN